MTKEVLDRSPAIACYELGLVTPDQPGLEQKVRSLLSGEGRQIEVMVAERREAPMCGGMLLTISIQLMATAGTKIDGIIRNLEALSDALMVDAGLCPA